MSKAIDIITNFRAEIVERIRRSEVSSGIRRVGFNLPFYPSLICILYSVASNSVVTVYAAPRPKAPPPPAQGTITITYFGDGEHPVLYPYTQGQHFATVDYTEVHQIMFGGEDKTLGIINLGGPATVSYHFRYGQDAVSNETPNSCYEERHSYYYDLIVGADGVTYNANFPRTVQMSDSTHGTLSIDHYSGPLGPETPTIPHMNGSDTRQDSIKYINNDCWNWTPRLGSSSSQLDPLIDIKHPFPEWWTLPPDDVPVTLDRKGHLRGDAIFQVDLYGTRNPSTYAYPIIPVTVHVKVDVNLADGLIAVPGGPYVVERGNLVTLDASDTYTTDGVAISSYVWEWSPGPDCPPNTELSNTATAATPSPMRDIVPLCGLELKLTVTDAKRRVATATTMVTVRSRTGAFAETPVNYIEAFNIDQSIDLLWPFGEFFGINLPGCANPPPVTFAQPVICPTPTDGSWQSNGYTIGEITDPGGPFDGFAWIDSVDLTIDRLGWVSDYFSPNGPKPIGASENWYQANLNAGYPAEIFLNMLQAHEGYGLGSNPLGGHMGALTSALTRITPSGVPLDPRRSLEMLWAPDGQTLKTNADFLLNNLNYELFQTTKDPRSLIWSGEILIWENDKWVPRHHDVE